MVAKDILIMEATTRLINDAPIGEKQTDWGSSINSISKLIDFGEPEDGSKYEALPTCQDVRDDAYNKLRSAVLEHNIVTSHFIKCQDGTEEQIISISPKPTPKVENLLFCRGKISPSEEADSYYYFILKNGARITAFRTLKADIEDVSDFINDSLKIYPEDSEIYQISFDEYLDVRKMVRELRRIFQRIRKRNIQYKSVKEPKQDKIKVLELNQKIPKRID